MINRVTYRFKTQVEFAQEFGPEWRTKVLYRWAPFMDRLFGFPVSKEDWKHAYDSVLNYPLNIQHPSVKKVLHNTDKPKKSGPLVSVSTDMLTSTPLSVERPKVSWPDQEVKEKPPVMPIKVERSGDSQAHYITENVIVHRNYDHPPYISARGALIYSSEDADRFIASLKDAVTFMKILDVSPSPANKKRWVKSCKKCGKTRPCYKRPDGYICRSCLQTIHGNKGE